MKKKTIIIMASVILALVLVIAVLLLTGGKKITITFDTDGGNEIASIKIKKGSKTNLPKASKDEYVFDGWYLDGIKIDDSHEFNEDSKLIAHYKSEGEKDSFTVTFETDGGDEIDPMEIKCGEPITLPVEPEKEGYTFIAWENEEMKTIHDGDKLACSDTTLTASWDKEDDLEDNSRLTIRFDSRGGSDVKSIKIVCKDAILPTLPVPTKDGYIFTSWQTKSGKIMTAGASIGCDNTTFYANWKEDPDAKYMNITFESNGGSKVNSKKILCGKKLELPKNPTRDGYTFISWADDKGKVILNDALLTCEDITLYANWEEKEIEKKEYECQEGTLKDDKCILEKPASEECPSGYTYSEKLSKCYKYISDATSSETEPNTCPNNSTYKTGAELGIEKDGCYSLTDKEKNCNEHSGYELSNGKCIKTIDAKVKE